MVQAKAKRKIPIRNVDVEAVVKKLGIEYVKKEEELYAKCPNPGHSDRSPSWHINTGGGLQHGLFYCWSCGWKGNIFKLVMTVKKCSFPAALRFVNDCRAELNIIDYEVKEEDYEINLWSREPGEIGLVWKDKPIKTRPIIRDGGESKAYKYLLDRKIGGRYILQFGMLDWIKKQRIIVPIRRNSKMISWVARSYAGSKTKTLAPQGAPKRWEIFNYDGLDMSIDTISVIEGWADAIRLMQAKRPNPAALCGSKVSEYQAEFISKFKRIEVWKEGDKAGDELAEQVAGWFGRNREIFIYEMPRGKDPGDFSPQALCNFKPKTWDHYRGEKNGQEQILA